MAEDVRSLAGETLAAGNDSTEAGVSAADNSFGAGVEKGSARITEAGAEEEITTGEDGTGMTEAEAAIMAADGVDITERPSMAAMLMDRITAAIMTTGDIGTRTPAATPLTKMRPFTAKIHP
jgi:hypothetical protein